MSIIGSNRKTPKSMRAHGYVDAMVTQALSQPSKRDLREMLAEAARNTAAIEHCAEKGDRCKANP